MNFLILDVYPNDNWRIVKDTAGGYGTGNNFGTNFLCKFMNFFVSRLKEDDKNKQRIFLNFIHKTYKLAYI